MRLHFDTDFGGDPDDACALAFLLGSPSAEIVGITTNLDHGGDRAGCVRHYLDLAGRTDIPVAAGAAATLTDLSRYDSTADDPRYWPEPIGASPPRPGAALDLLKRSVEQGATIVATGAATNLAVLEVMHRGILAQVDVVFMGGWLRPPAADLPQWGPEADWNVQCDPHAARLVARTAALTLVPLPVTLNTWLRASHLPRLRSAGPVGALLARQSEAHALDRKMSALVQSNPGLPPDLLNFHYDPVTCAAALGWPGADVRSTRLHAVDRDHLLVFEENVEGRPARVVQSIDGEAFSEHWLDTVASLAARVT